MVTAPPPPASPGPVAPLPAANDRPCGTPRLASDRSAITVPRVDDKAAVMLMSPAAHIAMLPSVDVIAARWFTLPPALSSKLPRTIVMAAFTLMSFPQQTTRFPWVASIGVLILTLPAAFNVSVVLSPATRVQANVPPGPGPSLKLMSPAALPVLVVVIVTSVPPVRSTMSSPALILDELAPGAGE